MVNSLNEIERLYKADKIINSEQTGTPYEFGVKLHTNEREVYRLLNTLRIYGAKVKFNKKRKTYFYEQHFNLNVLIDISATHDKGTKALYFLK